MNRCNDDFFALLRSALWGEPVPFEELDAERGRAVLALAREQTVTGLVADALIRNHVRLPRELVMQVLAMWGQMKAANESINEVLAAFCKRLSGEGIAHVVFKGQTCAALYPNPLLRCPGDIDFYCYGADYAEVKRAIESICGVTLPETIVCKEEAFTWQGTPFELHKTLLLWGWPPHTRRWRDYLQASLTKKHCVEVNGVAVPTLDPTLNAVYVFIHLFFHFVREGVGLRQLCDWCMALTQDGVDAEQVREMVARLGLEKAYRAFGTILVDKLGLPESKFPFALTAKDRLHQARLLCQILNGGNFGHSTRDYSRGAWVNKVETARRLLGNIIHFTPLAPAEMLMFLPKQLLINARLLIRR